MRPRVGAASLRRGGIARGGVGEEQVGGLVLADEIEAHLSGALGSEPAVGAHAVAIRDRSEAVE